MRRGESSLLKEVLCLRRDMRESKGERGEERRREEERRGEERREDERSGEWHRY